jgi:putative MATE family efflux protein
MFKVLDKGKAFYRALFRLAMPVMLQNLLNSSLVMVGTFMLGRLGETEIAAATLANTPFFVVQLIIFGFQSGSSVLFSQYWGKRDLKAINRILGIGVYACAGITFVFSLVCFLFAPNIMAVINRDPEIIRLAAQFMRITSFSYVLTAISVVYISAQRSIGNSKLGLMILTNTMVIDTILCYVLIFGKLGLPAMGVRGAAYAVLTARIIEFIITMGYAFFIQGRLKLDIPHLVRPGKVFVKDFIKYSGPVVLNEAVWGLGFTLYSVIYSLMDKSYLAAYTIAGNIEKILSSAFFGFAIAAGIIIGQLIGAGKEKEARETGKTFNVLSAIIGLFLSGMFMLLAPVIVSRFNLPPATMAVVKSFTIVMSMIIPLRCNWVVNAIGTLRAGGDTKFVFLLDTVFMWMLCLPLAAVFGLWLKLPVIWVILMPALEDACKWLFGLIRFCRGKWINNVTRPEVYTGDEALTDERVITHLEV